MKDLFNNLFPKGFRRFWVDEGREELQSEIAYVAGSIGLVRMEFFEDIRITISYLFWRIVTLILLVSFILFCFLLIYLWRIL